MPKPNRLPADRVWDFGYVERLCSKCRDWWPASEEFFLTDRRAGGSGRLFRECKACYRERRGTHRRKPPC